MVNVFDKLLKTDFRLVDSAFIVKFWNDVKWEDLWLESTYAFHKNKKTKIRFLKLLMYYRSLFSSVKYKGGEFNTTLAAQKLGVSQKSVCSYLKQLEHLGWVSNTNPKWAAGHKAREWRVVCPNLRSIQLVVQGVTLTSKVVKLGRKTINTIEVERETQVEWDATHKLRGVTRVDNAGEVTLEIGSDELRQNLNTIVDNYAHRDFNLLFDFAVHCFRHQNKYTEDRKRWMAEHIFNRFQLICGGSYLMLEDFVDASFLDSSNIFKTKSKVVNSVISAVAKSGHGTVLMDKEKIRKWRSETRTIFVKGGKLDNSRLMLTLEREAMTKPETRQEALNREKSVYDSFGWHG